jgi:hypothetical protein
MKVFKKKNSQPANPRWRHLGACHQCPGQWTHCLRGQQRALSELTRPVGGAAGWPPLPGAHVVRGGFLPTEVMDLAGCARPALTWLEPEGGGGGGGTMCFLLGSRRLGPRVLLLVPHYNVKMQFDS